MKVPRSKLGSLFAFSHLFKTVYRSIGQSVHQSLHHVIENQRFLVNPTKNSRRITFIHVIIHSFHQYRWPYGPCYLFMSSQSPLLLQSPQSTSICTKIMYRLVMTPLCGILDWLTAAGGFVFFHNFF